MSFGAPVVPSALTKWSCAYSPKSSIQPSWPSAVVRSRLSKRTASPAGFPRSSCPTVSTGGVAAGLCMGVTRVSNTGQRVLDRLAPCTDPRAAA